jgi:transcriptional regulator with XRE-family HTH domain
MSDGIETGIEMNDQAPKRDGRRTNRSSEELERIRAAFIDWVQHILDQKGWNPTDLANKSELAPSTLLRIMNSKTHPFNISFMTIRKVADGSGYPVPRALMEAAGVSEHSLPREELPVKPRGGEARVSSSSPARGAVEPPVHSIPLRHISALPRTLSPKVPDGQEVCPRQMDGDETAFAFLMPDDSLQPAVRSGMKLFATKRRDPAQGDIVLLVDKDGRARVRFVDTVDEDGFHLERLHPEKKGEVLAFTDVEDFGVVEGVWRR